MRNLTKRMRRSAVLRGAAATFAIVAIANVGCEALLGVDFDDVPVAAREADAANEADARDLDSVRDTGPTDTEDVAAPDARVKRPPPPPPECGDVSGLDPHAPWPMAGFCPTRQNRSTFTDAPPAAHLKWRFLLPTDAEFIGGAAVDADGTAYLMWHGGPDTEYRNFLSALRDRKELWRTDVTDPSRAAAWGEGAVAPVLAANGAIYAAVANTLVALSRTGAPLWTKSLEGRVSVPLVLGDGTIVVRAQAIHAFDPAGKEVWTYEGDAPGFASAVTASASGVLFAVTNAPFATGQASVHAFTSNGTSKWVRPLRGTYIAAPLVDIEERLVIRSGSGLTVFDQDGKVLFDKATPQIEGSYQPFAVSSPPRIWFPPSFTGIEIFDVESGNSQTLPHGGQFVATRDGALMFVGSTRTGADLRCLESDGTVRWSVPIDVKLGTPQAVALGADGTVYAPIGGALYVVGP